jgi:hypothetical protein
MDTVEPVFGDDDEEGIRGERIDSMVDQWRNLAKAGGEPTKY